MEAYSGVGRLSGGVPVTQRSKEFQRTRNENTATWESKRCFREQHPVLAGAITTRSVVGASYHACGTTAMAKRKIRAFYRQFIGAIADIIETR